MTNPTTDPSQVRPELLRAEDVQSIHHRTDRSEEAIALLERAVGERSRSYPFGMELWMSAQIDLAQLHRATGNEATAEALEGELRALTSQADPDFWLLRRLTH